MVLTDTDTNGFFCTFSSIKDSSALYCVLTCNKDEPERPVIVCSEDVLAIRYNERVAGLADMVHHTGQGHCEPRQDEHVAPVADDTEQQYIGHDPKCESCPVKRNKIKAIKHSI